MRLVQATALPLVVILTACGSGNDVTTALSCSDLTDWSSPGIAFASVEEAFPEEGPAHCKVAGTIDGTIRFELLLPMADDWNERFVMGGGGGFVGSVENSALAPMSGGNALERGFATVGTDTGHTGTAIDASWALDNEEAEVNFGHRAIHRTTEVAKEIIVDYYAHPIEYSYFIGCSRGGGQAMIEAQRYPDDYDGIVAMAPAYSWPRLGTGFLQIEQRVYPNPADLSEPVITDENRALLEREILSRCDASDGVEDGLLTDPRTCDFDPADLACSGAADFSCLTANQLEAVRAIYSGPEIDGQQVFAGFPFGGENDPGGWDTWITGGGDRFGPGIPNLHWAFGTEMFKYLIFDDPDFDYSRYDFANWESDIAAADRLLSAVETDLSGLRDSGGKLLFWHGWSDPALTALGTIDYYEAVEARDPQVRDYSRLFLAPGVLHCGGGPGPDRVDYLSAIGGWVEDGQAPDRLLAQKIDEEGQVTVSRPLCSFPQIAVYNGSGDTSSAASFDCEVPE